MTDVLERAARLRPDRPVGTQAARTPADREENRPYEFSTTVCVLVASLSAGAGVIHLATALSRAGTGAFEVVAFMIVGGFQLATAAVLVGGRSPFLLRLALLRLAVAANVAFIVAWAMSRITGPPWGEHAWHPESIGLVGVAGIAMEVGFIVGACALVARPRLGRRVPDRARSAA